MLALLLEKKIYKEYDIVCSFITDSLGLISVKATSAQKFKSKFGGKLDIGNICNITIRDSKSKYHVLTDIEVVNNLGNLKKHFASFCGFIEIIKDLSWKYPETLFMNNDVSNTLFELNNETYTNKTNIHICYINIITTLLSTIGIEIYFNIYSDGTNILPNEVRYIHTESDNLVFTRKILSNEKIISDHSYKLLNYIYNAGNILDSDKYTRLSINSEQLSTLWMIIFFWNKVLTNKTPLMQNMLLSEI